MSPDVEVIFDFIREEDGGRKLCASGYRPAHKVRFNYLTSGIHEYYDKSIVYPGEFIMGTIKFITPEYYPKSIWKGKIMTIQEGGRIVGYAKVLKVFNDILFVTEPVLAFSTKPEPIGLNFFQDELCDENNIEQLFYESKIYNAEISKEGWDFIINYHGYKKLFEINNKSKLFKSKDENELKLDIEAYIKQITLQFTLANLYWSNFY